jgi:hypothetical protein
LLEVNTVVHGYMDIMKEVLDLDEASFPVCSLKEEQLLDVICEGHHDSISFSVTVSERKVSCVFFRTVRTFDSSYGLYSCSNEYVVHCVRN